MSDGPDEEVGSPETDVEMPDTERDPPDEFDTADDPFVEMGSLDGPEPSPEELEDLFEPVETADLDSEAVWDAVFSEDGDEPAGNDLTGGEAVVPKSQYCKRCEFFSEPPDVVCRNPGTEIVELVGADRFQVTNCPVVEQRGRAGSVFPEDD